jgi:potassium voltage-gated channel Eag-related subfamily H protein 8
LQKQRINFCPNTIFLHPVTGYDEIPEYLVEKCISCVKKPLTHIFNASLSSGTLSDRLKLAKVIPLHEKGEHPDIKNYRPISILSPFFKIFEKLMYNRLMPFLIQNNIQRHKMISERINQQTQQASLLQKVYRRP